MNYQQQYCELKAGYAASVAKLKILQTQIKVLQKDPEKNQKQIKQVTEELQGQEELVECSKKELRKLESVIGNLAKELTNIELKVFHLKYVKGNTTTKIAAKLNYSQGRIKQILKGIKTKLKGEEI